MGLHPPQTQVINMNFIFDCITRHCLDYLENYDSCKKNINELVKFLKTYKEYVQSVTFTEDDILINLCDTTLIAIGYDFKNQALLGFPTETIKVNLISESLEFGEISINLMEFDIPNIEIAS